MRIITYKDWENEFPSYVIIRKEGYFYAAHNSSAVAINRVIGYKIFIDEYGRETIGGSSLKKIEASLKHHGIRYVVVGGNTIISRFDSGCSFEQASVRG